MGLCASKTSLEIRMAQEASRRIDAKNQADQSKDKNVVKMLLLGAGESGKSTIFKQMKLLYGQGFTLGERQSFKLFIWGNVLEAMKSICDAAFNLEGDYASRIACKDALELISQTPMTAMLTPTLGAAIAKLWADPVVQEVWARRSEFQVIETAPSYFIRVTEVAREQYIPSVEDILLSRVRTTGIVEEKFRIGQNMVVVVDVGGQRNERKKWIHCFEGVNAVIFVSELSTYDQMLFEDSSTNRMVESIRLFDEICNSRWFTTSEMILFLNKRDLFEEKIRKVDVKSVEPFSDYVGEPFSYEHGLQYFISKFQGVNRNAEKEIFVHVTCATDTTDIQFTFGWLHEIIIKQNAKNNLTIT